MNSIKLKVLIIGVFLVCAASVFFVSNNTIKAQIKETTQKKAEILEKVAKYKTWDQINKSDKKTDITNLPITDPGTFAIDVSSAAG